MHSVCGPLHFSNVHFSQGYAEATIHHITQCTAVPALKIWYDVLLSDTHSLNIAISEQCLEGKDCRRMHLPSTGTRISYYHYYYALQISKAASARDGVSKQLAETDQTLTDRTQQLAQSSANLEARKAELSKLSQQHQALIVQHDRTEGELSDLTGMLKQKQKDSEALQQRCASRSRNNPPRP